MLTESDFIIVTPSRNRPEPLAHTLSLVQVDAITVGESNVKDYEPVIEAAPEPKPVLIPHPDDILGNGAVRKWILDNWDQKCVVVLDDDIIDVKCLVGRKPRSISDPQAARQIIYNAGIVASELGTSLFSFAITPNIIHFPPYDPFGLTKANGPCLGFIGRDILPDPDMKASTDCDIGLKALLRDRFIWQDRRYVFDAHYQSLQGGNDDIWMSKDLAKDIDILKSRWGYGECWRISASRTLGVGRSVVTVKRRQQTVSAT